MRFENAKVPHGCVIQEIVVVHILVGMESSEPNVEQEAQIVPFRQTAECKGSLYSILPQYKLVVELAKVCRVDAVFFQVNNPHVLPPCPSHEREPD